MTIQTSSDFNPLRPMKPKTVEQAMRLQSGATLKRAIGRSMIEESGDHTGGRFELAEADAMEIAAEEYLQIDSHVTGPQKVGNGGELIVATREAMATIPGVVDTVRENPDMLTATASRARLELTGNALPLAVDAAESIKPKNSLEKMLVHQMAASHRLAMLSAEQSAALVERLVSTGAVNHALSVEAARLAGASARMMAAFQDGLLALDRIRRGGRQTVKVVHQHVAVGPGGQAVVAGNNVKPGGRKRGRGAPNGR
jgi:hypothetical protein